MGKFFLKKEAHQADVWLAALLLLLTVIGLLFVYSTTGGATRRFYVQLLATGIGAGLGLVALFGNLHLVMRYRNLLYAGSILVLAAVLVFGVGKQQTGASSWIRIGSFGIQPSEPIKVVFVLVFSDMIAKATRMKQLNRPGTILKILAAFIPFCFLIVLQNDTGTALVYVFMFLCMLFAGGLRLWYFAGAFLAFLLTVPMIWLMLAPYQKDRILVFFHPETDPMGAGYQVMQSGLSISGGGLTGRGWMQGIYNKLSLLPEKETDFIFGVIGEELGFVGCTVLVLLLTLFCLRCFMIAAKARGETGRLICVGIGAMFLFHIMENIGMCLGLLPVTGIPLPFISYGGSSQVTCWLAAGVIQNVYAETQKLRFYKN